MIIERIYKKDVNDERSKLVRVYSLPRESFKPKAFIMENVKALGVLPKSWGRAKLLVNFTKTGYRKVYSYLKPLILICLK